MRLAPGKDIKVCVDLGKSKSLKLFYLGDDVSLFLYLT